MVSTNKFDQEFGRTVPQARRAEYASRYQTQFQKQLERVAERLNRESAQHPEVEFDKVAARLESAGAAELRDAWGTGIRIDSTGSSTRTGTSLYTLRSAGPDKQFFNGDDLTGYLQVTSRPNTAPAEPKGSVVDLHMEHDRGPFNGLAEIDGTVTDPSGVAVPGASVTLREVARGKVRSAKSDGNGQFKFTGVPPGICKVEISAPGFRMNSRWFTLAERDRATLSATLSVGATTETVTVEAAPAVFPARIRVGGAVAFGGNMNGVIGGIVGGGIG
jgi:hypothetical protein